MAVSLMKRPRQARPGGRRAAAAARWEMGGRDRAGQRRGVGWVGEWVAGRRATGWVGGRDSGGRRADPPPRYGHRRRVTHTAERANGHRTVSNSGKFRAARLPILPATGTYFVRLPTHPPRPDGDWNDAALLCKIPSILYTQKHFLNFAKRMLHDKENIDHRLPKPFNGPAIKYRLLKHIQLYF